jgi:hypothetical protein
MVGTSRKSPRRARSEIIRCSDNCRTCVWSADDCTSCYLGFLKLEESYRSHERLNFELLEKEAEAPSKQADRQEEHKAVKSKCVEKCPEHSQNFTIVENRVAGMCV